MLKMTRRLLIDSLLLGAGVWLLGYLAGIALYFFVPQEMLGWILFAIFTPVVSYICYRRFNKHDEGVSYYAFVASVWFVLAIVLDYVFLVMLLGAPDYYKLDVYVYYASAFLIPFIVGTKFGSR